MKRLFFIIFILSFIFSTELAAVMFRVRLMDSDHNEFLENITLHFTDLDDRTLETIELTRNSGILKERSITGKFNLNLILKYKNIEFIDGLSEIGRAHV